MAKKKLRDGNIFYFLFSALDQTLIKATTIVVDEIPYSAVPPTGSAIPQSLRIRFDLVDPKKLPKLRPLAPGKISFRRDPSSGLTPPDPVDVVPSNYSNWPTIGTLMLEVDLGAQARVAEMTNLLIMPSILWYSNVNLTQDFLFTALPTLEKPDVLTGKSGRVTGTSQKWLENTISGFLKGRAKITLASEAQQADDSLAKVLDMPEVVYKNGQVELIITAANDDSPFDGLTANFDNPNKLNRDDPTHPRNGAIPTLLVYRSLRTHSTKGDMIDAGVGNSVPDRILPTEPRYYPIRFTRIWKAEKDCSVHFPSQVVNVQQNNPVSVSFSHRLPAHGILYVALTSIQALNPFFTISITSPAGSPEREMWWLDGNVQEAWHDQASNIPISIKLKVGSQDPYPHVILRRRMGQEVIFDRVEPTPGGGCTYTSLRRAIRALVNNRVAGGRLNFEVFFYKGKLRGQNRPESRRLVTEALGKTNAMQLIDGAPDPNDSSDPNQLHMRSILEKFFPDTVPPHTLANGMACNPTHSYGWAAFSIWQSDSDKFENTEPCEFMDDWLGGGGAGALVALGLAADYAVNPGQTIIRNTGESAASFAERIARQMLSGVLQPGAALQLWDSVSAFDDIRKRQLGVGIASGHSPIFLKYDGPANAPTGIFVLDQGGKEVRCPFDLIGNNRKLVWRFMEPDVWIAANWSE